VLAEWLVQSWVNGSVLAEWLIQKIAKYEPYTENLNPNTLLKPKVPFIFIWLQKFLNHYVRHIKLYKELQKNKEVVFWSWILKNLTGKVPLYLL
jgi:hypothetical protein